MNAQREEPSTRLPLVGIRLSVLLWLWAGLLVIPSSPATRFDGVPFSSIPEAVAVVLFLPVAVSPAYRRLLTPWFGQSSRRVRLALLAAVTLGLVLKVGLLAARPVGFVACYESTLTPPQSAPCERSFENPFFRFGATRIDQSVDFGPDNWDLSFVNSLRFNLYPWVPGNRRRDRLPFAVTWRGFIESAGTTADIVYVGEAVVAIDDTTLNLPPAYDRRRGVKVDLPAGRHVLRVRYSFDDGSLTGTRNVLGPYATFHLKEPGEAGEPARAVRAAPAPAWVSLAAGAVDIVGLAGTLAFLFGHCWLLRRHVRALLVVAVTFTCAFVAVHRLGLPAATGATLVAWSLLGLILVRNRSSNLLIAYFTVLLLGVWLAVGAYPRLGAVWYRSAGDDWLTYESFARTILETGSLAGGESVFYIQPFFRYVRFLEHFLFGDGDAIIDIFAWAALHWSVLWAASVLLVGAAETGFARWRLSAYGLAATLFAGSAALTLALAGSETVVNMTKLSLSEHATWIFLAAAIPLLASRRRPQRWPVGAAFLAAALITRPNQAPALFVTAVAFLGAVARPLQRPAMLAGAVFTGVCLLPLAHNLYYSGRPVLFTTSASHPATLGVPISTLAKVTYDAAARIEVLSQIRGLMFFPPLPSVPIGGDSWAVRFVMHGLQVGWLASIWLAWRWRLPWSAKLLVAVPLIFLMVHIVYDIRVYYPRHILAAYFAMGLVTMAVSTAKGRRATSASADTPR